MRFKKAVNKFYKKIKLNILKNIFKEQRRAVTVDPWLCVLLFYYLQMSYAMW